MQATMKEIRQLTGLSQRKFAARYKIPAKTLEKWEQGCRKPPAYVLELLARSVAADVAQKLFVDAE